MFETLAERPLSGAVLDLPLTRGYATLGDGVLEFTDEEHGPSRLTFAADDVEVCPPCLGLQACGLDSTPPPARADCMAPCAPSGSSWQEKLRVGRVTDARTTSGRLAFSCCCCCLLS